MFRGFSKGICVLLFSVNDIVSYIIITLMLKGVSYVLFKKRTSSLFRISFILYNNIYVILCF